MKIQYLKEFVELAKRLNFSTSAEHLYISQPVLSRHISALENELGIKLFKRNTQNVILTRVGLLFFGRIQALLEEYDKLCDEVRLKEQGFETELRIGLPYYSMDYYMGQVPFRFAKDYPNIMLTYLTGHPDQLIEALRKNKVNLLIIANMTSQYAKEFAFYPLFKEPLTVLLPSGHKLAKRESVSLSDLADETFLGVESNLFSNYWTHIRNLCLKNGFEPRGPVKFNQLESVILAIKQKQGIVVEGNNLRNLNQEGLTPVKIVGEGCFRAVSIVYKEEHKNPVIPLFIKTFENENSAGWQVNGEEPESGGQNKVESAGNL